MLLSPNLMVNAQFVAPVTADEITGCSASQVENTGTSALGDLQVIVWDGDAPGISFIDHSSSPATVSCFNLITHTGEGQVKDPDVVWDYGGGNLVLVVYEEHNGSNVSVWSQMWRWNGGSPVLETMYGSSGYLQLGQSSTTYPNVDADFDGHAVAVWEKSPNIYAKTIDFGTLTASSHLFWVDECATAGIEPDVAMRNYNDATHVSFVYADPVHIDIIVVQEYYGTVQSSTTSCNHLALAKPTGVTIDYVGVPRIAMPNWETTGVKWFDGWDASVVYEGKNSTDYLIVTANRITHWQGWIPNSLPWIPPYTWYCGAHTYSSPAFPSATGTEWISDILNISGISLAHPTGILQLNPPLVDLHADGSLRPVVAQVGDFITYNAWTWEDNSNQFSGYDEVLMRRLMLDLDGTLPFSQMLTGGDVLTGNYEIPIPTTEDYFLVSDGNVSNEQNDIVSIAGTSGHAYFAFVHKGSGSDNIVFKRSVQAPNTAVRKAPQSVKIETSNDENVKSSSAYPNPFNEILNVKSEQKITAIHISDINGREIWSASQINAKLYSILFAPNQLREGLYILEIIDEHGLSSHVKLFHKP